MVADAEQLPLEDTPVEVTVASMCPILCTDPALLSIQRYPVNAVPIGGFEGESVHWNGSWVLRPEIMGVLEMGAKAPTPATVPLVVQAVPVTVIVCPISPTVALSRPLEAKKGGEQENPDSGMQTFCDDVELPKTPSLNNETMTNVITSMDHP